MDKSASAVRQNTLVFKTQSMKPKQSKYLMQCFCSCKLILFQGFFYIFYWETSESKETLFFFEQDLNDHEKPNQTVFISGHQNRTNCQIAE